MLETLQNFDFVKLSVLRGIRAFRVTRLLRFIKVAKGIRKLTYAFVLSLPALFNICILLVLIISIYAIVGMTSFGFVKKTGALNDVVNFETFIRSFVLLFRLMTSAGWNDILDALMIQGPDCDPSHLGLRNGNCGRPVLAQFYFVSFVIITYITLVNMYIAVILENFNRIYKKAKVGITDDDIDMYYSRWALYDPKATEYIHFNQLSDFVDELDPPLRVPESDGKAGVGGMDISLRDGDRVHCLDLLHALVRHLVLQEFPKGGGEYNVVMERLEERFLKTFPSRNVYVPISTVKQRTMEIKAALIIQRAVKRFKNARETSSRKPSVGSESQNLPQRKVSGHARKRADSRSNLPVDDGIYTAGSSPPRDIEANKSRAVLSTIPPAVCSSSGLTISDDLSLKSVSSDNST